MAHLGLVDVGSIKHPIHRASERTICIHSAGVQSGDIWTFFGAFNFQTMGLSDQRPINTRPTPVNLHTICATVDRQPRREWPKWRRTTTKWPPLRAYNVPN